MCYMEPYCVSINLGPLEEARGKHKCDLNNATDENSLVDKPAFTYLAMEVISYKQKTPNYLQSIRKKLAVEICKMSVFQFNFLFLVVSYLTSF